MRGKVIFGGAKLGATLLLLCGATLARADQIAPPSEPAAPQAQDSTPSQEIPPPPTAVTTEQQQAASKKWEFATIGYVWFAGAWGETDVIGPVSPVDLSLPFGKVLKGFKFAFMGAAEAKHDRFVAVGDLTFIHLGTSKGIGIRDPGFLDAHLDSRTSEVTLLGGYRVLDDDPVKLDLLAGGRLSWFKTSLDLEGPNRSASGSVKQTWLDPLIGARIKAPLGGKWSFSAYGDLGGIIFGSDITWQAIATVNYQISRKINIGAGWRHFKVNYDHGDFLYNVYQTGPLITFRTIL
jgi:hypothetical protein